VGDLVDEPAQIGGALAHRHHGETHKDGEQQYLEDIALGEGADHRIRNDVEQELDGAVLLVRADIFGDGGGVGCARKTRARLEHIADHEANHQRESGDDLEIDQGLDADASDLRRVLHMRDAGHHGAEDDRGDHHLDQFNKTVAERLDSWRGGKIGKQQSGGDTERDCNENLHIKQMIERLLFRRHGGVG
jgi:hypothetical protein